MKVEKPSAVLEKAHAQLSKKTPCKCVGKLVFECHLSFKIKEGMWRDLVSIKRVGNPHVRSKSHLTECGTVHTGKTTQNVNQCGSVFTQKQCFITDQNIHAGKELGECNECEKSADKRENLIIHQMHAREKSYECGSNEKVFIPKSSLSRCLRGLPGDKPNACHEDENVFNGK